MFAFPWYKRHFDRMQYLPGSAGTVWSEDVCDEDRAEKHRLVGSQAVRGAAEGWWLAWKAETRLSLVTCSKPNVNEIIHKTAQLCEVFFKKQLYRNLKLNDFCYIYLIFYTIHFTNNCAAKILKSQSNKHTIIKYKQSRIMYKITLC